MEHNVSDILIQIRGMQNSLPKACQKICDVILENPSQVLQASVHTLAEWSGTSDATVIRLCRMLGFEGYRPFLISLSAAVTSAELTDSSEHFSDIQAGASMASIIDSISQANQQSIRDTLKVLDPAALEAAADKLAHARNVILCGLGASGLVCMDAEQKLLRIGRSCHSHVDGHSQLTAAALLGKGDAALLVSNSGETMDILDTLELLKANGVCTISLTRYGKNALAAGSDIPLYISTTEILFRSGAMGSRIAMLNVIDILFASLVSRNYTQSKNRLFCTRQALEKRKTGKKNPNL